MATNPRPPAGSRLSQRERTVVAGLARGRTNEQIADDLHVSYLTVKTHLARISCRYGTRGRAGIVHAAYQRGDLAGLPPEPRDIPPLTMREMEVLDGMCRGLGDAAIAGELDMALSTVKVHARHIYRKLQAEDRAHAVALGHQHGLLVVPAAAGSAA